MNVRKDTVRTIVVGPVLDADGAAKTDEVVASVLASKNGGNPSALDGSATLTHKQTGFYLLALTANDIDTLGCLEISLNSGTNTMPVVRMNVMTATAWDALYAASGGYVPSALQRILGTALTETQAGYLAAAFKKLFDVATPLLVASDVMRGTDSANTTVPDAAGTAAGLHATTDGKIDTVDGKVDTIAGDVENLDGEAMRGTDSANTTVPDAAGIVATALGDGSVVLHSDYNAAKTAAQAGDAMTLTDATHRALEYALAHGTNVWHVSKAGNDGTATGSAKLPYLTIAAAVAAASNGDHILFGPGTYTEAVDGSALSGIILEGSGWDCILTSTDVGGTLLYGDEWTVRNCVVKNTGGGSESSWALVGDGKRLVIDHAWIFADSDPIWHQNADLFITNGSLIEGREYGIWASATANAPSQIVWARDSIIRCSGWTTCSTTVVHTANVFVRLERCQVYGDVSTGTGSALIGLEIEFGEIIDTDVYCIDAPGVNGAIDSVVGIQANGRVSVRGGRVYTAGGTADPKDLVNAGTTLSVSGLRYDTTKTTGTITHVEPDKSILEDVTGLNGAAMRGTDGANTTVPDAAGTAAGLHTTTDGKVDAVAGKVAGLNGEAMRGTDGANTTVPDAAGTAVGLHTTTDGKIDAVAGKVAGLNGDAMRGTDGANTTVPDAAGTGAALATLISALNNLSSTDAQAAAAAALAAYSTAKTTSKMTLTDATEAQIDALQTIANTLNALVEAGAFTEAALVNTPEATLELTDEQLAALAAAIGAVIGTAPTTTEIKTALEASGSHLARILTKALLIGSVNVTFTSPVISDTEVEIVHGSDYKNDDSTALTFTATGYSGPTLASGATGTFKLLTSANYNAETGAWASTGTVTVSQSSTTVTVIVELTAAETAALETAPDDDKWNYRYHLRVKASSGRSVLDWQGKMNVKQAPE